DGLERFGRFCRFPALANDFLKNGLPNGIAESLPDYRVRGLSLTESGQPRTLSVVPDRLGFSFLHTVHRYRHAQRLRGWILGCLFDCDLTHRPGNLPLWPLQGQFCRARCARPPVASTLVMK